MGIGARPGAAARRQGGAVGHRRLPPALARGPGSRADRSGARPARGRDSRGAGPVAHRDQRARLRRGTARREHARLRRRARHHQPARRRGMRARHAHGVRRAGGGEAMTSALMIQGTGSDAGKSTLVTGLCRAFRRRGMRVAPFKPQNMALNSAVTVDGGEIGRAQAVQAQACGLEPHSDMNPVLLKPSADTGAQVIIHGRVHGDMDARRYHSFKREAMAAVMASFDRLKYSCDLVLVEGAGSPAEINLRGNDIANMGFAEAADVPVVLLADIERGGVFAQFMGTLQLVSDSERARIRGFVINRFRGDLELLRPGLRWLENTALRPVLGVLPYLEGLHLEAEDALPHTTKAPPGADRFRVVVPAYPR